LGSIFAENCLQDETKLKLHFLCEKREGEEKPGENVSELKWVKPSEIESYLGVKLPSPLHEYITNLE
jgi:hypothetical protein